MVKDRSFPGRVSSCEQATYTRKGGPFFILREKSGLAHLVSVAATAGWLPPLDIGDATVNVAGFAAFARELRNLLHPGRHLALPSDWTVEEAEAADVQALLKIVDWLLQNLDLD